MDITSIGLRTQYSVWVGRGRGWPPYSLLPIWQLYITIYKNLINEYELIGDDVWKLSERYTDVKFLNKLSGYLMSKIWKTDDCTRFFLKRLAAGYLKTWDSVLLKSHVQSKKCLSLLKCSSVTKEMLKFNDEVQNKVNIR